MIYINKDNSDEIPNIPMPVAICPICQAELVIDDLDEWETETGRVTEAGLHINCSTAPNLDSNDWDEWWDWHWSMPYVDWLPVGKVVYRWFDANYRLKVTDDK